ALRPVRDRRAWDRAAADRTPAGRRAGLDRHRPDRAGAARDHDQPSGHDRGAHRGRGPHPLPGSDRAHGRGPRGGARGRRARGRGRGGRLTMARRRRKSSRLMERYASDGGLTLTSMMDILTTLLFFVLKSYVSGGEVTVPPPGVTLPRSTAKADMHTSVVVAIDHDAIMMGGERVATVHEAVASHELLIPSLAARLAEARHQMDDLDLRKGA